MLLWHFQWIFQSSLLKGEYVKWEAFRSPDSWAECLVKYRTTWVVVVNETRLCLDKKQGYGMTNPDPKCPVMRRRPFAVTFGPQSAGMVQTFHVNYFWDSELWSHLCTLLLHVCSMYFFNLRYCIEQIGVECRTELDQSSGSAMARNKHCIHPSDRISPIHPSIPSNSIHVSETLVRCIRNNSCSNQSCR